MGIHNICLYKEVDIKYNSCTSNLTTTEFFDCAYRSKCGNKVKYNTICGNKVEYGTLSPYLI